MASAAAARGISAHSSASAAAMPTGRCHGAASGNHSSPAAVAAAKDFFRGAVVVGVFGVADSNTAGEARSSASDGTRALPNVWYE